MYLLYRYTECYCTFTPYNPDQPEPTPSATKGSGVGIFPQRSHTYRGRRMPMGVTSNWCHLQGHHARRPPTTVHAAIPSSSPNTAVWRAIWLCTTSGQLQMCGHWWWKWWTWWQRWQRWKSTEYSGSRKVSMHLAAALTGSWIAYTSSVLGYTTHLIWLPQPVTQDGVLDKPP